MTLFSLSFSSAVEFEFSYPESVRIDNSFEVEISSQAEDTFDVKVFVHKSESDSAKSEDYISDIYNDGWKNSWNYIKEAFPEQKIFRVEVTSDPGERTICVRLRKSGTDSTTLKCDSIEVKKSNKEEGPNLIYTDNTKNETNSTPKETQLALDNEKYINEEFEETQILLKNAELKTEIKTSESSSRNFILYSVIFTLSLLVVLLALRRI